MEYYDILQYLKCYNIYIYSGNKESDIDLIEMEVDELRKLNLITKEDYVKMKNTLRKTKNNLF